MMFDVYKKNQKSLTVENLNIKLFFQTEFIKVQEGGLPLHKQLHNHSYVEIFACLSGRISINTAQGITYELFSGDMALVPSAVEHFKAPETLPNTDWIGMGFICREVQGTFNTDMYGCFSGLAEHNSILVYKNVPHLCQLIVQCHDRKNEDEISSVLSFLAEFVKLPKADDLRDNASDENAQKSKNIDRLLKLDDIVNTNFTKNFSNKEIAEILFISERQLSRIVAKNYGQPLRLIIMKKRLDVAAELLLTTSDNVETIAASVGFKNKNSFHREFKKRFGKTPSEYRKTM